MKILEGFAQPFDIRGGENGANVEIARNQRRSMKDRSESADDDEFDVSREQALQEPVEFCHAAPVPLFRAPVRASTLVDAARDAVREYSAVTHPRGSGRTRQVPLL